MKTPSTLLGRDKELAQLQTLHASAEAKLVVMYGRRRIGKTFLIRSFIEDKTALYFDGLEDGSTEDQLEHVAKQLFAQTRNPLLASFSPRTWQDFFMTLLEVLSKKKAILVFDELQWLARGRTKFVSVFKSYWDGYFLSRNLTVILCGSIAHYMVKKVIKSKSLYGRINCEMLVGELEPPFARKLLGKRGELEGLQYQLILGGVPKYLNEVDQNASFDANIQRLFFSTNSFFWGEIEKIFFAQFKEARVYKKIIAALADRNLSLGELATILKLTSGGSLKGYLENLEMASFVRAYKPLANKRTKEIKYKLVDGYLRFYYQYISKREKVIASGQAKSLFIEQVKPTFQAWLGLAFEVFLHKNAMWLAERLEFAEKVIEYGPYLINNLSTKSQIDLAFIRSDKVITVVEVKFGSGKISTEIISEVERKVIAISESALKHRTVEKVLIVTGPIAPSVKASQYFHKILGIAELLRV